MPMQDHTEQVPRNEQRYPELDALRGLASLSVVFLHFHDTWNDVWAVPTSRLQSLTYDLLRGLYNGGAAVLLFFVLSGFVLSLPILRGKSQPYFIYALRRILRIYGPYLGALALGIVGCTVLYRHPHPPGWSQSTWSQPPSASLIVQHLLFLGVYNTHQYVFVIWTLVQEMRISLLFPFLFVAVQRLGRFSLAAILLVLLTFGFLNGSATLQPTSVRTSLAQTFFYLVFFTCGILLATHAAAIRIQWKESSPAALRVFTAASLTLYFYGSKLGEAFAFRFHPAWFKSVQQFVLNASLTLLGCMGCIILALNLQSANRLLRTSPMHFLGRISYSLYLVHPCVLLSVSLLLYKRVNPWLQLPLYLAASLLLAWIFCLFVEEPFIRVSRNLSGWTRQRTFSHS